MTILSVLGWVFNFYFGCIFVYILLSWLPHVRQSPLGIFLGRIVEPYLSIFRQIIPPIGMIDLSPIVALFALHFIEHGLRVVIVWLYSFF